MNNECYLNMCGAPWGYFHNSFHEAGYDYAKEEISNLNIESDELLEYFPTSNDLLECILEYDDGIDNTSDWALSIKKLKSDKNNLDDFKKGVEEAYTEFKTSSEL